jgi:hypothetical protein
MLLAKNFYEGKGVMGGYMKGTVKSFCTVALIIAVILSCVGIFPPTYASTTRLYVDPPSIVDVSLQPSKNFSVSVKLDNVNNLYGVEFKFYWDTSILDMQRVILTLPWTQFFIGKNETNEDLGSYWLCVTAIPPSNAYSGNATLVKFTFKVTGEGSTTLDLADTVLGDFFAEPIEHEVGDGFFSNVPITPSKIYIHPAKIINPQLKPTSNFTLDINIENGKNLYSFDLKISYNTTVLDVLLIKEGDFLKSFGSTVINRMDDDPASGVIWVAISLVPPAPPASGNGTLLQITFLVRGFGESEFHLYDVLLMDSRGNTIPYETFDSYFNNVLLAKLFVDPPSIIDPSLTPATTFSIDIKVANVTDLFGYKFELKYDTIFLNGIGVLVHPQPKGETNFIPIIVIDDRNGVISVNVTYLHPAASISTVSPITLVTITFQVANYGASVLNLSQTKLIDSFGESIPHETCDGFISVAPPDVAILEVSASPITVYRGSMIIVKVVAANLGIYRKESFTVTVYNNDTAINALDVAELPPHTNITLSFVWDTSAVLPGVYVVSARASVVPLEVDTANNFLVGNAVKIVVPNVAITRVSSELSSVYPGWKVTVVVVVVNRGLLPVNITVAAYYDNNLIGNKSITNLASDVELELVFIWDTSNVPCCHNYTISAGASLLPFEENASDNIYVDGGVKVRIVGDVSGDDSVNILDMILASTVFNTKSSDLDYNMYADINRDGSINVLDMILISTHLGESCK